MLWREFLHISRKSEESRNSHHTKPLLVRGMAAHARELTHDANSVTRAAAIPLAPGPLASLQILLENRHQTDYITHLHGEVGAW